MIIIVVYGKPSGKNEEPFLVASVKGAREATLPQGFAKVLEASGNTWLEAERIIREKAREQGFDPDKILGLSREPGSSWLDQELAEVNRQLEAAP